MVKSDTKEYRALYNKKWRARQTKERLRSISRNGMKKWRKDCRLAVFRFYSNGTMSCACCGENTYEFLCIDHINGGGRRERKEKEKAGSGLYRWLIKQGFPDGYQLLCHNCNMAKGFYKTCPHNR